jgi:hypothetical protein
LENVVLALFFRYSRNSSMILSISMIFSHVALIVLIRKYEFLTCF